MTPRPMKVKQVEKQLYTIYLNRAKELYASLRHAEKSEHWASVGVNAVHCAISLNDAITVFSLGQRNAGEDHATAAALLYKVDLDGVDAQSKNLARIIAKKTAIEYEERDFRQADALDILKQVERFYQWGISKLPN
jgi:hypothetical protein